MALAARRTDRTERKRRLILEAARSSFGEHGFERTSVDGIAARAGVSKATVYAHFADKKALFVACFSEEADVLREGLLRSLGPADGDLPSALQRVGEALVNTLTSPGIVGLYRHTSAEVERFPEVGASLFERGPDRVYGVLADWLRAWQRRGALRLDDPRAAAVQLGMLCQGDLVLRAQLGVGRPSEARVRETVRRAVRTFLRAYGT